MRIEPIFKKIKARSISDVVARVTHAEFPEGDHVEAVAVIRLKAAIKRNCDILLEYVHSSLPEAQSDPGRWIILNELRRDIFEVRAECAKVKVHFLRPRHRRILAHLRVAYEEMKLAAIVLCQQDEPALIDNLTDAL